MIPTKFGLISVIIVVVLTAMLLLAYAARPRNPLVGSWTDAYNYMWTFRPDGRVSISSGEECNWFISGRTVTFERNTHGASSFPDSDHQCPFEISDDGKRMTLYRTGYSKSTFLRQ